MISDDEKEFTIAYHTNVTDLVPELGSARFVFNAKVASPHGAPENVDVTLYITYQALESLSSKLPMILADMRAAGCDQLYSGKKPQ